MKRILPLLVASLALPAFAEDPPPPPTPTGFPPYGSFEHLAFDTVNRQNLNFRFAIPIASSPGRGFDLSHALTYDWRNTCPSLGVGVRGTFNDRTLQSPTWTAPINPTPNLASCTISVEISDGRGVSTTVQYAHQVGPFNDGYKRHVFSTVVKLSNPAGRSDVERPARQIPSIAES